MKTLKIKTNVPYNVYIGKNVLQELKTATKNYNKVLVCFDGALKKEQTQSVLANISAKEVNAFSLVGGESCKTENTLKQILEKADKINLSKKDCIIAVGGGAVLDVTGLASALYKRGVNHVNVPTTFLAMADASVGGKTAINFNGEKNNVGTIYQPNAVICDLNFLENEDESLIKDGLAEIVKCAIIGDKKLFNMLNTFGIEKEEIIFRALKVKSKLVKKDELDKSCRRLLNLGHTFAHAIEKQSEYSVSHGIAVATGLVMSAELSNSLGVCKIDVVNGIKKLLSKLNIETVENVKKDQLYKFIEKDKKADNGKIYFVLPKKIGRCIISPLVLEKVINES